MPVSAQRGAPAEANLITMRAVVNWTLLKGQQFMLFEVGETVVYPHHGAATITEVKTRIIKGEEKVYLKLRVTQGDLTIEVPADNVDLVGVRDVIGREGLDKGLEVLRAPFREK